MPEVAVGSGIDRRTTGWIVLGVAAFAACLVLGFLVAGGFTLAIDLAAASFVADLVRGPVAPALALVTWSGDLGVSAAATLAAAAFVWLSGRPRAAALVATTILAGAASSVLKLAFALPRPDGVQPFDLFGEPTYAYPSGHVVRGLVLVGVIGLISAGSKANRNRLRPVLAGAIVVGLIVGLGRMAASVHWLSDVVGGVLLGIAWLAIIFAIWDRSEA